MRTGRRKKDCPSFKEQLRRIEEIKAAGCEPLIPHPVKFTFAEDLKDPKVVELYFDGVLTNLYIVKPKHLQGWLDWFKCIEWDAREGEYKKEYHDIEIHGKAPTKADQPRQKHSYNEGYFMQEFKDTWGYR